MAPINQHPPLITVFGGSGFLGRNVVRALAQRGCRIRVAVRNPNSAHHLQPLGNVGQIHAIKTNLRHRGSVDRAVHGASHVVNLVGILHESGSQRFSAVQSEGARAVAEAARSVGAGLTHVSAIGADPDSPSGYGRTKFEGEQAVLDVIADTVIFRPSIIFGAEDNFFNRFASMARMSPILPLIGGGHTLFQPVYVVDVAEAIARSVDGKVKGGRVYELGGPQKVDFRSCMKLMLRIIDRKRLLLPIPWSIAQMMGTVLGLLPNPQLTVDQVKMLRVDNVVSDQAEGDGRAMAGLGITPHSMEAILPSYLWQYRLTGQFTRPSGT